MKQKDLIFIFGSLFFLVLGWIILSIYHNFATSTIPENISTEITAISATFDTNTIKRLKERIKISPLYELNASLNLISTDSAIKENIENIASKEGDINQ